MSATDDRPERERRDEQELDGRHSARMRMIALIVLATFLLVVVATALL